MRRRSALLAAGLGVVALAVAPSIARSTTAAWTDDAVFVTSASAAEFFGCQQGPVIVTTLEPPLASTVTVLGIDPECAGADMTVRVYDELIGGELGEFPLLSSFETGIEGWVPMGASSIERTDALAHSGAWSLRSFNRTQSFEGPSRDVTGLVVPGETYLASVWVYQTTGSSQPFQFTLRETMSGGGDQFPAIAAGSVPSGEWTQLTGEITVDPDSVAQLAYVEATANPTMEFFIDEIRAETAAVPPEGAWVTATGPVTLPEPTLDTDQEFHPVDGLGAMPVEVVIDGFAVPATWDYEAPAIVEGCTVVLKGTLTPAPGATCESVNVTVTGGFGPVGSRILQLQVGFTAPGTATDDSHQIVFTTDLSTVPGMPANWDWDGSGLIAGSFLPVEGYSCVDLPSFSARAPGWASANPAYLELHEQPVVNDPVCGP